MDNDSVRTWANPATCASREAGDSRVGELDLSDKNAKKLRDALSLYTASARRSGRRQARSGSGRSSVDTAAIRSWAKSKGYEVSDRGRISADILEAYKKADKRK